MLRMSMPLSTRYDSVLVSFFAPHLQLPAAEVHVLDPQGKHLRHSQPAAIQQPHDQPGIAFHMGQEAPCLLLRQHHRDVLAALRPHGVDAFQRDFQHFAVEEEQRIESLVLSRGGQIPVLRQMGQKGSHLFVSQFGRMPHATPCLRLKSDMLLVPADISLLGAPGLLFEADGTTDLFFKAGCGRHGVLFFTLQHPNAAWYSTFLLPDSAICG